MANRAADRWLDELGAEDRPGAQLPLVVRTVAVRAQVTADDGDSVARIFFDHYAPRLTAAPDASVQGPN